MTKEKELENLYNQLDDLEDEIRYIKSLIEDLEDELEGELCIDCNGSGEGRYDGTTCWHCKGKGVV